MKKLYIEDTEELPYETIKVHRLMNIFEKILYKLGFFKDKVKKI